MGTPSRRMFALKTLQRRRHAVRSDSAVRCRRGRFSDKDSTVSKSVALIKVARPIAQPRGPPVVCVGLMPTDFCVPDSSRN